jgi:hypothetical protein
MDTKHMTVALYDLGYGPEMPPVQAALRRVPGVIDIYIDPFTERAYVDYDPEHCNRERLVAAIQQFGVPVPAGTIG